MKSDVQDDGYFTMFFIFKMKSSDYLKKARKYGHFTGYEN